MAKASWCTVAPMSGSKNGSIAISASAHTGRAARTTNVTVTNANGTRPTAAIAVSQAGAAVVSTIDATKPDIPKTGGTVVVNGTSNSQKLKVYIIMGIATTYFPAGTSCTGTISINGGTAVALVPTNYGFEVSVPAGDPGASARYNYVLNLIFNASLFPVDTNIYIRVADSRYTPYDNPDETQSTGIVGETPPTGVVQCTTKLLAGASVVSASPASVSLVNAGTAQNVAISSNDDWTVS